MDGHRSCVKAGLGTETRDHKGRLLKGAAALSPHAFRRTAARNLEFPSVPRSIGVEMIVHKTEAICRRYAIGDAKARRAPGDLLAQLREEQKRDPRRGCPPGWRGRLAATLSKVGGESEGGNPRRLVAWDGVEPPTRGSSAQSESEPKKDDDAK